MRNPFDMTGHRVLVTGASSGIGRATAELLAEMGCQVVLAARDKERLASVARSLAGRGHQVEAMDLSKSQHIAPWLRSVVDKGGALTGLVHSAGAHRTRPVRFEQPVENDPLWAINFHAASALLTAFRKPGIRSAAKSSVVFVSSIVSLIGQPGIAAYCATKGALNAYTRAAALELARESIRVNCVAPGHVHTMLSASAESKLTDAQVQAIVDSHPLGVGAPSDVANAILFLLADTSRWITGSTLVVDGGYTVR